MASIQPLVGEDPGKKSTTIATRSLVAIYRGPQGSVVKSPHAEIQSQKSCRPAVKSQDASYKCMHCSARFQNDGALIVHCLTAHTHLYTTNTGDQTGQAKRKATEPETLDAEPKIKVSLKYTEKPKEHVCLYCRKSHFSYLDLLKHCRKVHPKQNVLVKEFSDSGRKISAIEAQKQKIKVVITKGKGNVRDNVCRYCGKTHSTIIDLHNHYTKHRYQYAMEKKASKINQIATTHAHSNTSKAEDNTPQMQPTTNSIKSRKPLCEKSKFAGEGSLFICEGMEHHQSIPSIQPTPSVTSLQINEVSEARIDSNLFPSNVAPLPLCIVNCHTQRQTDKHTDSVSDLGESAGQEPNIHCNLLTQGSGDTNTNVIEIQPVTDLSSDRLSDACEYSGDVMEQMMGNGLPYHEDTNAAYVDDYDFKEPRDETKVEVKCQDNVIKKEDQNNTIQKDKVVIPTNLTKAETSDALKAENLGQEYSKECKLKEDKLSVNNAVGDVDQMYCPNAESSENPTALNMKINIPIPADTIITEAPQTVTPRDPCQFCAMTDSQLSEFIIHYCLAHRGELLTKCPQKDCRFQHGFIFITYSEVKQHYESQHCAEVLCGAQEVLKGLYGLSCAYCPERYKNRAARDKHYLKNHYMILDTKDFTGTGLGKHLLMVSLLHSTSTT